MALGVAAVAAGGATPPVVQVQVTGLTPGLPFTVTGSIPSGWTWTVRGGNGGPALTASMVLADARAPLNVAITYTATHEGETASAGVTIPYAGRYVLQSLDGRTSIPFYWQANGLPRALELRSASFEVPGRTSPVVRWDVTGGETGSLTIRTSRTASETLRQLLRSGPPVLLLRTDGAIRDLDPVECLLVRSLSGATWDAIVGPSTLSTDRAWSLAFTVIDDPEPSAILPASTWDDFDGLGLTWGDSATTVRTNRALFPQASSAWTPYYATGGAGTNTVETVGGPVAGMPWRKATVTTAGTGTAVMSMYPAAPTASQRVPVTAGETITASTYALTSVALATGAKMKLLYQDAAGAQIVASGDGTSVPTVAGTWLRVSVTHVVPAGAVTMTPQVYFAPFASLPVGSHFGAAGVLIESGSTLGAYFDGDTADTASTVHEWAGAVNASASTATTAAGAPDSLQGIGMTWDQFDLTDWANY